MDAAVKPAPERVVTPEELERRIIATLEAMQTDLRNVVVLQEKLAEHTLELKAKVLRLEKAVYR